MQTAGYNGACTVYRTKNYFSIVFSWLNQVAIHQFSLDSSYNCRFFLSYSFCGTIFVNKSSSDSHTVFVKLFLSKVVFSHQQRFFIDLLLSDSFYFRSLYSKVDDGQLSSCLWIWSTYHNLFNSIVTLAICLVTFWPELCSTSWHQL